jgi:ribosomal protein S20
MKTANAKKVPGILRRPIDPTGNLDEQAEERCEAIFSYYGLNRGIKGDDEKLVVRMVMERFPNAFRYKCRPPDKRIAVSNVAALKRLVTALQAGVQDQLTDSRLKALGSKVRRWLNQQNKKATQRNVCGAISKLDTGEWKGVKPGTLRDHVIRPIGSTARSEHARQKVNARLVRALGKFSKGLNESLPPNPDDDDIEC